MPPSLDGLAPLGDVYFIVQVGSAWNRSHLDRVSERVSEPPRAISSSHARSRPPSVRATRVNRDSNRRRRRRQSRAAFCSLVPFSALTEQQRLTFPAPHLLQCCVVSLSFPLSNGDTA